MSVLNKQPQRAKGKYWKKKIITTTTTTKLKSVDLKAQ